VKHVARHLKDEGDIASLSKLRCEDLYLAYACATKDEHAIELLDDAVRSDVRQALLRHRVEPSVQTEVLQRLRTRLFVPQGEKEPRIAGYGGHGPVAAWVCAAAVRLMLDLRRESSGDEELDEQIADNLADEGDLEVQYIKHRYRKEFRLAFQEAFRALEPSERNLMRFNFIDGLNIEEIGAMTGVHRSTVARHIARIRETLFETTRKVLTERFALSQSELNSLLRLVRSNFDVSLHEALRSVNSRGR
jgi:RNA polymerase sigma-70 factor (ECF subfamily)